MVDTIYGKKYKTGMYGGAFNPLHLGHVDCMLKAAGLCEKLFIVISYRKHSSDVDVKIKYRWVYLLTKHLGNVRILTLEDPLLNKSDYTKEYWEKDCEAVRKQIGEPIDVVFCGSDYDENSFWNLCYPESRFVTFERNAYNSTAIRNDPYRHWDWMPSVVRSHYVKKVLLIGGESVGKSTLTINLAHHFNTNFLEEVGRELSEISGTDEMMLSEDYQRILLEHKNKEIHLCKESNRVLFEDTDCLITRFFMEFLKDDGMAQNAVLAEAIAGLNQYDLILFLEPDVTWIQDGDRSGVMAADRQKYSQRIKDIYSNYGFSFVSISGSYVERFEKAVALVEEMLYHNRRERV